MHRKGAQDARRGKIFTKLIREITVAAREGAADPDSNPRLRTAITTARAHNMPKDNIERAIKKGSGEAQGESWESIRYEGYGPGGVAIIVDTLTDNRNRTASSIRTAFTKHGGSLGETNSVSFQFERIGFVQYPYVSATVEEILDAAIEIGADDCHSSDSEHEISCNPDELHQITKGLEEKFGSPTNASLIWKPKNTIQIKEEQALTLFKLIEVLEDDDDVQNVSSNLEISDDMISRLDN